MRRGLALLLAAAVVAAGAFAVTAWIAGGGDDAPAETVTTPAPLARLKIIFPEGFTIAEMADRVAAVRQIAIAKAGSMNGIGALAGSAAASCVTALSLVIGVRRE